MHELRRFVLIVVVWLLEVALKNKYSLVHGVFLGCQGLWK